MLQNIINVTYEEEDNSAFLNNIRNASLGSHAILKYSNNFFLTTCAFMYFYEHQTYVKMTKRRAWTKIYV